MKLYNCLLIKKKVIYFFIYIFLFCQFSCHNFDILTESEKEWLKEHPNLIVGLSPNAPPYQFINDKGEEVGIFIDFLTIIEDRINYNLKESTNQISPDY